MSKKYYNIGLLMKKAGKYFPLLFFTLIPTLLIWLPFFFRLESFWNIPLPRDGMVTIVSNYDGPFYIAAAKTLYNKEALSQFSFNLPLEYYAAHFPLFPLLIRLLGNVMVYPYAMLLITVFGSFLSIFYFYKLVKNYVKPQELYWITFVFSIFPARWLVVRSVGSPEPLFIGAVIASIYCFKNKKYFWAGIWGALAQLTKSPGILLFIAYIGAIAMPEIRKLAATRFGHWIKTIEFKSFWVILIPVSLLSVFIFYSYSMNDFFAYFHSGDNIHLVFPPFQVFNYQASWVNTHWLEEIIIFYLLAAWGVLKLIEKKEETLAWFTGIFLLSIFFVSHRDIIRYALPIIPFLYIAYSDIITSKKFKIAFTVIILPIYLFSLAFISKNTMPISDWTMLL